jgi:nucleotide-binding universal stress UspA family protein
MARPLPLRLADILIALTTHGRRGLSRLLLGSVADKVVRGSTLPVLLYRPTPSSAAGREPIAHHA